MGRLVCTCELWGETFSPKLVAQVTGILFSKQSEVGDVGSIGRYRGTSQPYGAATISVPNTVEQGEEILWLTRRLMPHIQTLRDAGASDIYLNVGLYHEGQCNWSLSAQEFRQVAALDIYLNFSSYEEA